MTREEAIQCNKNLREYMRITDKESEYKFLEENYIALDMAIKALEQEPTTKNDLGVDCISRDDVRDVMQELWGTSGELMDRLMALPSVTPIRPKGHWIINKEKSSAKCSNCKFLLKNKDEIKLFGTFVQGYNYCPNCGADMREVEE